MLSGSDSGTADRSSAESRRADAGGTTGSPSICSIGVARPTLLPYWPMPSEIAPALSIWPPDRAVDRRAREAGPDAGLVDRRAGDAEQDPRALAAVVGEHVDDLDRERRDRRPAHDAVAGAVHARRDLRQRHDRIAAAGRRRPEGAKEGQHGGGRRGGGRRRTGPAPGGGAAAGARRRPAPAPPPPPPPPAAARAPGGGAPPRAPAGPPGGPPRRRPAPRGRRPRRPAGAGARAGGGRRRGGPPQRAGDTGRGRSRPRCGGCAMATTPPPRPTRSRDRDPALVVDRGQRALQRAVGRRRRHAPALRARRAARLRQRQAPAATADRDACCRSRTPTGAPPTRASTPTASTSTATGSLPRQPETQAKLRLLEQAPPMLFVDQHEQDGNAVLLPAQRRPGQPRAAGPGAGGDRAVYGPALRARVRARTTSPMRPNGTYDLFYPGFGDSALDARSFGAAGMTFEAGDDHAVRAPRRRALHRRQRRARRGGRATSARCCAGWADEWLDARAQGQRGARQPNRVIEPGDHVVHRGADDARLRLRARRRARDAQCCSTASPRSACASAH